jgi:hypothetical protein
VPNLNHIQNIEFITVKPIKSKTKDMFSVQRWHNIYNYALYTTYIPANLTIYYGVFIIG